MNLNEKLSILLEKAEIRLNSEQIDLLVRFVNLISKWNKVYNLTSIKNFDEMLKKHILDSLVINKYLIGKKIADIGTGAGLPGIPLAIANPEKTFMLLDSRSKRTTFLNQVKIELKLNNVNIVTSRVENYNKDKFDVIISRAFSSLKDFHRLTRHLCSENSFFFALKGKEPSDELTFLNTTPNIVLQNIIELKIPELDGDRHLVIMKSI